MLTKVRYKDLVLRLQEDLLFNCEGPRIEETQARGCSSVGRAPALHAGGREFEPLHLHHKGESPVIHGLIAQ